MVAFLTRLLLLVNRSPSERTRTRSLLTGPTVTNSSVVVPYGSLQAENGVDWTVKHGSNVLDGTNTRLSLGIAYCTEFLIVVPTYFLSINGSQPSGFSDVVVSFKRQLIVPFDFNLSATAGLGFPSGSSKISGHGYQPYIQFPWSHEIADGWEAVGMFTLIGFQRTTSSPPCWPPMPETLPSASWPRAGCATTVRTLKPTG